MKIFVIGALGVGAAVISKLIAGLYGNVVSATELNILAVVYSIFFYIDWNSRDRSK